jgi:hypothetical protein
LSRQARIELTESVTDRTAYRIQRRSEPRGKPAKYRATYTLVDEQSQETVVQADLIGRAVFGCTALVDHGGRHWTLQPDRKVMPTRWLLSDEHGSLELQFDQKLLGKLANPLFRTVLAILDAQDRELMQFVNLHSKKAAFVLGLELGKYALVRDQTALAELSTLPREKPAGRKGFLGSFKRFMAPSDRALISLSDRHPLPPPAALAMYLLYEELTDTSGG